MGIFRTFIFRSQPSSCSHVRFVWSGAFLLYKVQIFVDMITNALRPDSGGCQAVRVSHRSKLGLHVVDPKHQSLMAEVQIHLPMLGWP